MTDQDIKDIPASPEQEKYDFDFHTLTKTKRQEHKKLICLMAIIFLLSVIAIVFIIMFAQEHLFEKKAKGKAYQRIAKYGEECSKDYTCGKHAFCRQQQGTYLCDCINGFYGDGMGECRSGLFSINFKKAAATNIPILRGIDLPRMDSMSISFWMYLDEFPASNKTIFSYVSNDIEGENALIMWLNADNTMTISFRNQEVKITRETFKTYMLVKRWTHFSWVWHSERTWAFYINTELVMNSANSYKLKESFPASKGDVILGQALQNGKIRNSETAFVGKITDMFIYNKELTNQQVKSAYESYPYNKNIAVGWWQFKNLTNGKDIVETSYPFSRKFFLSKRRK